MYAHTAAYDAAIAAWFAEQEGERFPARLALTGERQQALRYGENPDQRAAFYVERPGEGLGALVQRGGKELSFNNLLDLEGALLAAEPFLNLVLHINREFLHHAAEVMLLLDLYRNTIERGDLTLHDA